MTDSIDPDNVRWDIINFTIEAFNGGGFNVTPGGYLFAIGPVGVKDRPYTPEFSPLGVLAIIANRIFANEIRDGSYAARFQLGFMELPGHTDPLDPDQSWWCTTLGPLYCRAIFGTDQIPAGLMEFNNRYRYQAATCLEQWQRQLRVTHVRWPLQREMTRPYGEYSKINDNDIPVSYIQRYEERHQAALDKMAELLQEEYPNATSIMVRAGDDFSPQAWESYGDYIDSEFYDLAMELEGKAVAHAMELHPDPDPFESGHDNDWYCLTVEEDGFTLFRNGNSDATPHPSLRMAVSTVFETVGYGGYPLEYIVNDCVVLCGDCMTDEFLSEIEDYLSGASKVWVESTGSSDSKYYNDTTCENGHMIQPQLCPLCGDPVWDARPGESGDYRIIASQTNGELRIHGACLIEAEEVSDPDRQARRHVSREGLVYSVQVWGDRKDFIVNHLVEIDHAPDYDPLTDPLFTPPSDTSDPAYEGSISDGDLDEIVDEEEVN